MHAQNAILVLFWAMHKSVQDTYTFLYIENWHGIAQWLKRMGQDRKMPSSGPSYAEHCENGPLA